MKESENKVSRRRFFNRLGAGAAVFSIVPNHVLGGQGKISPSEKVNIVAIGASERMNADLPAIARSKCANVIGLCDVDHELANRYKAYKDTDGNMFEMFPDAKRFFDYRRTLETMRNDIDAVVIAIPNHAHYHAAMMSMQLGKHVYCEKPLSHRIELVRKMTQAAKKYKVVTQYGSQGHSTESTALARDYILDGAIGEVRKVVMWSAGLEWFKKKPAIKPVPKSLHYDLWLNREPFEHFREGFHPNDWRSWISFSGGGEVADMCGHQIDIAYYALDLGAPQSVEVEVGDEWPVSESYPRSETVTYNFPARGDKPPVSVEYVITGQRRLAETNLLSRLEHVQSLDSQSLNKYSVFGTAILGDKGTLLHDSHGGGVRILPDNRMKELRKPPQVSPRLPEGEDHWTSWVKACKGECKVLAGFEYGGPMSEVSLLGGEVTLRAKNRKIIWDSKNMKVTNDESANAYIEARQARHGWEI